jgi:hypothetical protein
LTVAEGQSTEQKVSFLVPAKATLPVEERVLLPSGCQ